MWQPADTLATKETVAWVARAGTVQRRRAGRGRGAEPRADTRATCSSTTAEEGRGYWLHITLVLSSPVAWHRSVVTRPRASRGHILTLRGHLKPQGQEHWSDLRGRCLRILYNIWISGSPGCCSAPSVQPPAGVMRGCGLLSPPAQHPASSSATGRDLGPSCCCCTGAGTLRQHRGGRRFYIPITVSVEDHHHHDILQGYIVLCCVYTAIALLFDAEVNVIFQGFRTSTEQWF